MISVILFIGWLLLAAAAMSRSLWLNRARPPIQAAIHFLTVLGLSIVPFSLVAINLGRGLSTVGPPDSAFFRCGKLLAAILSRPLDRPDLTISLALFVVWIAGLGTGAASAWRSQSAARRIASASPSDLLVVPTDDMFAFTVGSIKPRVVVSEGLWRTLSNRQRAIVAAHEEAHRRGRHPALLLAVETLAKSFPLAPVRRAADEFRLALEFSADEFAARQVGSRADVAGVIASVAARPETLPAFEGGEVARVRRLLESPPTRSPLRSQLLAAALLLLVLVAGTHSVHCGALAWGVLRTEQCRVQAIGD